MKEEVRRIMNLVKEGKLSPDDAAELIDAFTSGEPKTEESGPTPPPPPPPPAGGSGEPSDGPKDPFRSFVDFVETIGKEVSESVNWQDVAKHVRTAADRGMEGIKAGVDQLRQGKVNFGWFSAQEVKETTLPFGALDGKVLRIENACGNVKLTGGFDTNTVAAKAVLRGATPEDAQSKAQTFTLIVEESDHAITIRQPDMSGLSLDLSVQVSSASMVEVKTGAGEVRLLDSGGGCRVVTQSGDVHVRGLKGAIEVNAQNGDLHIEDCASPSITLEAKHGDISLQRLDGNVNARTAGGEITGRQLRGSTYSIESVSGDVIAEFDQPVSGAISVRTVNGDASVALSDGSDCRVSLSTLRGEVTCELGLEDEARMEQRITGRLGAGSGTVDVSAVNGDISMRQTTVRV